MSAFDPKRTFGKPLLSGPSTENAPVSLPDSARSYSRNSRICCWTPLGRKRSKADNEFARLQAINGGRMNSNVGNGQRILWLDPENYDRYMVLAVMVSRSRPEPHGIIE